METTRFAAATWMVLIIPLLVSVVLPLNKRFVPKHPLFASTLLYGFIFAYSFFMLLTLSDGAVSQSFSSGTIEVGYYIDQVTAATLILVTVISCITILFSPQLWSNEGGFVSLLLFSVSTVAFFALLLSDNLLLFVIFWGILDIGIFYGKEWDKAHSSKERWKVFLVMQGATYLVLGSVTTLNFMVKTTSFTGLVAIEDQLSPPLLTFVLVTVFLSVGIKLAGFPFSHWGNLSTISSSRIQQLPLLYGISAVLPGIYLLTRIHPLLDVVMIPGPVLLGLAMLFALLVFPIINRKYS